MTHLKSALRLELRDTGFNVLEILDKEYLDLSWAYSRIGGCGEFRFRLPRLLFEEKAISGDFNVRIYKRNTDSGSYDLWYQGLVENKIPSINGNSEDIEVSGHGYITQLSRIYVQTSYASTEVSLIVKDLLDNYITPNTNVSYSASDIEATSFTPSSIQFNDDALTCMRKLADLVGSREWGVDKNRNFFFKARSSTTSFYFPLGFKITNYQENQDFTEIVNRVMIQGAQSGGTYFTAGPYNDTPSQLKYNLRVRVEQNSSVLTSDVAQQLADAILTEFSEVTRKATAELVNFESQIEATIPIPLVSILGKEIKYGERKYGTFLYSGAVNRYINRINYTQTANKSLNINIDMGQLRPTIAEDIARLEYELDQARSAAL